MSSSANPTPSIRIIALIKISLDIFPSQFTESFSIIGIIISSNKVNEHNNPLRKAAYDGDVEHAKEILNTEYPALNRHSHLIRTSECFKFSELKHVMGLD